MNSLGSVNICHLGCDCVDGDSASRSGNSRCLLTWLLLGRVVFFSSIAGDDCRLGEVFILDSSETCVEV